MDELKELRWKNGISQDELSKYLNVSRSTVSMWECGASEPSFDILFKLAKLFNTSIDGLLGYTDNSCLTVYDRIRNLRKQKGLSQQELAELVGFKTASAINKIELGTRNINHDMLKKFANALSTTPSYLLGEVPEYSKSNSADSRINVGVKKSNLPYEESNCSISQEHINLYVQLNSNNKKIINELIKILIKQQKGEG